MVVFVGSGNMVASLLWPDFLAFGGERACPLGTRQSTTSSIGTKTIAWVLSSIYLCSLLFNQFPGRTIEW